MAEVIESIKDNGAADEAELARVKAESEAKLMRHRLDDYLAIILGVGSALILWILQMLDVY